MGDLPVGLSETPPATLPAGLSETPPGEDPIRLRDLILRQGIGQGAMAGFGDESEAAIRAAYDKLNGSDQSLSDLYDTHLQNARTMNKRFEAAHPTASMGAQAAGAVAPFLIPGLGEALGPLDEAALAGRAGNAALQAGAYGAAYGAGSGEGAENRALGAGVGGITGALTGGMAQPLVEGAVQLGSRYIMPTLRAAFTPGEEAGNRMAIAADQNAALPPNVTPPQRGLSDQEIADAEAENFSPTNIDRLGEHGRALADTAATMSPSARAEMNQTLQDNHLAQFPQVNTILDDMVQGQGTLEGRAQLRSDARVQNQRAYDAAYSHPNASNPDIMGNSKMLSLLAAPPMQDALRQTTRTLNTEAILNGHAPIKTPFGIDDSGNIIANPGVNPDLAFWDQMQRNLRDQVDAGTDLTGKMTNEARQTGDLRNRLLRYLDTAVPPFQAARQGAAGQFGLEDALDFGSGLLNKNVSPDMAMRFRLTATPAERELARIGLVDQLKLKFGNLKDAADLSKHILADPNERTKASMFLGANNMNRLMRARNFLAMQSLARNAVQGNSKTVQRLVGSSLLGGSGGALYGAYEGENPLETGAVGMAALGGTEGLGELGARAVNYRMAREMAHRLMANDPTLINYGFRPATRAPARFAPMLTPLLSQQAVGLTH